MIIYTIHSCNIMPDSYGWQVVMLVQKGYVGKTSM